MPQDRGLPTCHQASPSRIHSEDKIILVTKILVFCRCNFLNSGNLNSKFKRNSDLNRWKLQQVIRLKWRQVFLSLRSKKPSCWTRVMYPSYLEGGHWALSIWGLTYPESSDSVSPRQTTKHFTQLAERP